LKSGLAVDPEDNRLHGRGFDQRKSEQVINAAVF
jgi:hypothetical protein